MKLFRNLISDLISHMNGFVMLEFKRVLKMFKILENKTKNYLFFFIKFLNRTSSTSTQETV